ncbi:MAG TPA: DNA-binding response regulator [Glutamicibacter sp.]|uniref:Two-component system response regulator n=1 Tax=Glutamicibacter arilaitensis (strain DSM 16368 / CIP 108037 / IAM 15318 / JCM 13566 / NCIMB 14258 / Re117) TaxID=861360 RepID=A0ABP1U1S7_GLUAR|nr:MULTISPECIES: response regulator transcription factor [Glutamicibacter]CBT74931.1 two-component system response regulator [Glutamicibacter arilaitensis Re117]HCH46896.1 DNA-binding response regulator [Glutamicibacter sp.]
MKVLIVDDHATVRMGIRLVLQAAEDLEVVGEAADGRSAISMARALSPDVILMDLRMPVLDGIEATKALHGSCRVVVLTTFDDDQYLFGALQAGAHGFLLKSAEPQAIIMGVRAAGRGESVLDPQVTSRILARALAPEPGTAKLPDGLTGREREVLDGLAEGLSNPQLAQRLGIGQSTVKTHVSQVLAKLGVSTRLQAAKIAYAATSSPGRTGGPADPDRP